MPSISRRTDKEIPRYLDRESGDTCLITGTEDSRSAHRCVPVRRADATARTLSVWSQGRLQVVRHVELFTDAAADVQVCDRADGTGNKDILVTSDAFGGLKAGSLTHIPMPSPTGEWTRCFDRNSMSDVFVAVTWAKTA